MFNTTRADLAPWVAGGNLALGQLEKSLGLIPSGTPGTPATTTPGAAAVPGAPTGGYNLTTGWIDGTGGSEPNPAGGGGYQGSTLVGPNGQVVKTFLPGTSQADINTWLQQNNIPVGPGTPAGAPTTTPGTPATLGDPFAGFRSSPGYQFQLNQGMGAINNSASARGGVNSGATLKSLQQFGTGLANQDWYSYLGQLSGLSGSGQNAAAQTGSFAANAANQIGANTIGAGNAGAAGTVGIGSAINSGLNNALGYYFYNNNQPSGGGGSVPYYSLADITG